MNTAIANPITGVLRPSVQKKLRTMFEYFSSMSEYCLSPTDIVLLTALISNRPCSGRTLDELSTDTNIPRESTRRRLNALAERGFIETELGESRLVYGPRKLTHYSITVRGSDAVLSALDEAGTRSVTSLIDA